MKLILHIKHRIFCVHDLKFRPRIFQSNTKKNNRKSYDEQTYYTSILSFSTKTDILEIILYQWYFTRFYPGINQII